MHVIDYETPDTRAGGTTAAPLDRIALAFVGLLATTHACAFYFFHFARDHGGTYLFLGIAIFSGLVMIVSAALASVFSIAAVARLAHRTPLAWTSLVLCAVWWGFCILRVSRTI